VAERPNNIRAASILERGHDNSGGHHGSPNAGHSYRGSHRAGSPHHADDRTTPAQRRSSRVGRHHAENSEDLSGRW
jgi:hypothetical protein